MITFKVSWLKQDVSTMSLLPLLGWCPDGSLSAVFREQQSLMPGVYLLSEMGYGVKHVLCELAEHAACSTVLHLSRGSKSTVMKFTFTFTTTRLQVLSFPNWQNEQDGQPAASSTTQSRSFKSTCHLWPMTLAPICASRKMTELADSGDCGVEETHKPCIQILWLVFAPFKAGRSSQNKERKANKRLFLTEECARQGENHHWLNRHQHSCTHWKTRLQSQLKQYDISKSKRFWTILDTDAMKIWGMTGRSPNTIRNKDFALWSSFKTVDISVVSSCQNKSHIKFQVG